MAIRAAGVWACSSHSLEGSEAGSWPIRSCTVSPSRSTVLMGANRPLTRAPMVAWASSPYWA